MLSERNLLVCRGITVFKYHLDDDSGDTAVKLQLYPFFPELLFFSVKFTKPCLFSSWLSPHDLEQSSPYS